MGDVIYLAGHAHFCGNIGAFPQAEPWQFNRGIAFSKKATGTVTTESHGYTPFAGKPAPSLLNWFPILDAGTFTGQDQGAWTVAGNADYVVMAGEFTTINNQPQQGLARFPRTGLSPNLRGPRLGGVNFNPTLSSPATGTVRVRWHANWDQDDENLTYEVRRNGAVVSTVNQASTFWKRTGMTYLDTGLTAGQGYTCRIFARDAFGNEARSETITITVPGSVTAPGSYAHQVLTDKPGNYWRLGETGGATGVDLAGKDDLIVQPGVSFGTAGAMTGDTDTAATFNAATDAVASSPTLSSRPQVLSTEAWFRTGTSQGGEIIGFGNAQTGVSADFDRNVYMDNSGRLFFGVRPTGTSGTASRITVNTTKTFNDNQWHHVVATLGATGMQLFLDGVLVAGRTDTTSAWPIDGFWRLGGDNLSSWPSRPTSRYLNGQIDDVAIYPSVLPLSRVKAHFAAQHTYAAGGTFTVRLTATDNTGNIANVVHSVTVVAPTANVAPTAAFTSSASNLAVSFDGLGSADSDGTITSYASNFGDASTGTGATASHTYASAGSYTVTLTVTDDDDATGTVNHPVTVTAPAADTVVAADAFGRTVTGGFGTADTGETWALSAGNTNFAVNNGTGAVTLGAAGASRSALTLGAAGASRSALTLGAAGASRSAFLNSVSTATFDGTVTVSADKIADGGGMFASLLGRRANSNDYRAKIKVGSNGAVPLYLTLVINKAETTIAGPLAIAGPSMAANDPVIIRLSLTGTAPTALSAKVWRASTAEPSAWQLNASDSTAELQASGGTGLVGYLSGSSTNVPVVLRFDAFAVKIP